MTRTIEIDQTITVSNLAQQLELPATNLISQLVKNGLLLTLNERIDFETVAILVDELGLDVQVKSKTTMPQVVPVITRTDVIERSRPPVIAMMGHVDHGKTSLLDKIRQSDQVSVEAGGITQHISACQITHKERQMTFLDTPGHEAFAALREYGTVLTDLVILVIAADDGIKDQTLEVVRFIRKSGVKLIVAANKIDKPTADLDRLKGQLAENDLLPEDMGGDIIVIPLSAKTGAGIDELLDMILLVTDLENLTADSRGPGGGLVIEAYMKKGLGPVAVVLVQEGVLRLSDCLLAGGAYGTVRLMHDMDGQTVTEATASMPVMVSGLKSLPEFGTNFTVVAHEKEAKKLAAAQRRQRDFKSTGMSSQELLRIMERRTEISEYKIILKTDVKGSLTAIVDGLKSLDTSEVATKIVDANVGSLTESDIQIAQAAHATIYCFGLNVAANMRKLAVQAGVELRHYHIIYELLEDVKGVLMTLLAPSVVRHELGRLTVKGIFKTTKTELICGGQLVSGRLTLPATALISRDDQMLAEAEVSSLAKGPAEVKEVLEGSMCGLRLTTKNKVNLKPDDVIDFYRLETTQREL